jgi:hypothetical protein
MACDCGENKNIINVGSGVIQCLSCGNIIIVNNNQPQE